MKTNAILLLVLAIALSSLQAQTVPQYINYQGKVTDSAGVGIGTGTPVNRNVIFRIFDAATGGNRLWSEQQTVVMSNGEFSVLLGQGVDAVYNGSAETPHPSLESVFTSAGAGRFLEIVVDNGDNNLNSSDTPISPRQQLTTTAFSFHARSADTIASGTDLQLNNSANYGLGYYGSSRLFNGTAIDGPVLFGASGGALGSVNGTTQGIALRWDAGNKVSVGSDLTVGGAITATGTISSAAGVVAPGSGGFTFNAGGDGDGGLFSPADGTITIRTNAAERVRVDSSGNVGIGTTSPARKLDVAGVVQANTGLTNAPTAGDGGSGMRLVLWPGTVGDTPFGLGIDNSTMFSVVPASAKHVWYNGTTANMVLTSAGNLGIGTTAPAARLHIVGNVAVGGDIQLDREKVLTLYDANHGLGYYGPNSVSKPNFGGVAINGPALYGYSGGVLGTTVGGQNVALQWDNSKNVSVGGNITSNGKSVPVAEENLRFIRGGIKRNSSGVFTSVGTGFAASRTAVGDWSITFTSAFSGEPTVVASPAYGSSGNYDMINVYVIDSTHFQVKLRTSSGGDTDREFTFIVAGPR
jgi:hypothetical protein